MTGYQVDIQAHSRVAEVCPGFVALSARALAERLGVSERHARRLIERNVGAQHLPEVLRVVRLPVAVGKGAQRPTLHLLWPVSS